MKRRQSNPTGSRAARLAGLGLLAGALAGAAAAGDIETSYRKGRIAPAAEPAAPHQLAAPPAAVDGFGLAETDGGALAAALGFTTREDCRAVAVELRAGCLDHVAGSPAESGERLGERLGLPL